MKEIIIDFSNVRGFDEIHSKIKSALEFPDYYGENLDALWDCLTGYIETPVCIVIKDFRDLPKDIAEYLERVIEVFKSAQKEYEEIKVIVEE